MPNCQAAMPPRSRPARAAPALSATPPRSVPRLASSDATNRGARATRKKRFSVSGVLAGSGSTRWKVLPSRSGACASQSIARATKSTGTMFIGPTSTPTSGSHGGSAAASSWIGRKK